MVAEGALGGGSGGSEEAVGALVPHPLHVVDGQDDGPHGRTGNRLIVALDGDGALLNGHTDGAELGAGHAHGLVHQNCSGGRQGGEGGCSKG